MTSVPYSGATMTPVRRLFIRASRVVYNASVDVRFGGLLAGEIPTRFAELGANETANSDYLALDRMFADPVSPDDVLVDVGCGKGRVINFWLRKGLTNKIVGLELDDRVAARTRRRLSHYPNVTIVTGHAVENLPADGTLFYLFNPFQADVVAAFKKRLAEQARERGRVRVIYNNCKHVSLFVDDPEWDVHVVDLHGSPAAPYGQAAFIQFHPAAQYPPREHQHQPARGPRRAG
jgi:SAM-dependent methyltransferase